MTQTCCTQSPGTSQWGMHRCLQWSSDFTGCPPFLGLLTELPRVTSLISCLHPSPGRPKAMALPCPFLVALYHLVPFYCFLNKRLNPAYCRLSPPVAPKTLPDTWALKRYMHTTGKIKSCADKDKVEREQTYCQPLCTDTHTFTRMDITHNHPHTCTCVHTFSLSHKAQCGTHCVPGDEKSSE